MATPGRLEHSDFLAFIKTSTGVWRIRGSAPLDTLKLRSDPGGAIQVIRPKSMPTSVLLPADLIAKLREKGRKRGLGYQTMMKLIILEHVDEY